MAQRHFCEAIHLAWLDCMLLWKCFAWDASFIATLVTTWQLQTLCGAYLFSYKGVELWHYSTGFILDNCVRGTGALLIAADVIATHGRKARLVI